MIKPLLSRRHAFMSFHPMTPSQSAAFYSLRARPSAQSVTKKNAHTYKTHIGLIPTHTHIHTHTFMQTLSLSLFLSLSHTHTHLYIHSLSLTHTHTLLSINACGLVIGHCPSRQQKPGRLPICTAPLGSQADGTLRKYSRHKDTKQH